MEDKIDKILQLLITQNDINSKLNTLFLTKLTLIENLISASLMAESHKAEAILACKDLVRYSKELTDELTELRY